MNPGIIDIQGIGPAAAAALGEHGINSLADLARAPVEKITAVPGFSEARAVRSIATATELLAAAETPTSEKDKGKKSGKKDKSGGKDKKGKKDKKDKKNKGKGKGKKKDKNKKKGKK